MPDIDREKLAYAVAGRLEKLELSFGSAQARFKGVTKGLLSRIKNGTQVSAANLLCVCKHLELDPFDFLDIAAENPHSDFGKPHKARKTIASIADNLAEKSGGSSSCQM